jgi:hypothetical protein
MDASLDRKLALLNWLALVAMLAVMCAILIAGAERKSVE